MRLASAVAGLVALAAATNGLIAAQPAAATTPAAVIGTISAGTRYEPRAATVLGANAQGFVYRQETDQGFTQPGGGFVTRWHSLDGTDDHSLGNVTGAVVGSHLVRLNTSEYPNTVTDTALPSGTSTEVSVPAGDSVIVATADGVLVANNTSGSLGLQAWGTTSVSPITGLTAPAFQNSPANQPNSMTAHGALISLSPSTGGVALAYVDTSALHGWQLTDQPGYGAAIGASAISWEQFSADATNVQIATIPIPKSGDATAAVPTLRAATMLDDQSPLAWNTLPVGSHVLVWPALDPQQYDRDHSFPLTSVAADGTATQITTWAHGVVPSADGGSALLVSGKAPGAEQISRLAADTTSLTSVLAVAPIVGRTGQLAVDGSRVVRITDGAADGEVVSNTVAASGGALSVGADLPIATGVEQTPACVTGVCEGVAAAHGTTSFVESDDAHLVTYTGQTKTADTALSGQDGAILSSDGSDVLLDSRNAVYDSLYSISSGTEALTALMKPALASGHLVGFAPNTDETVYTDLNLATNTRTSIPLPTGCAWSDLTPQAAGPFVLIKCGSSSTGSLDTWAVVDQADASKSWVDQVGTAAMGQWWLGDGFVVRADAAHNLSWSDLSDPTHTWQNLGVWSGVTGTLAVDTTGAQATVAWTDGNALTHVAVLAVTEAATTDATALSTSPSSTVLAGDAPTMSTTLTDTRTGAGLPGNPVYLLQRMPPATKFAVAATTLTGPTGSVTIHARVVQTTQYVWYFPGTAGLSAAYSGITTATAKQQITSAAAHSKVARRTSIVIYGTVSPGKAGEHATLQRKVHGAWKAAGKAAIKAQKYPNGSSGVGYVLKTKEAKPGRYTFRVALPRSTSFAATTSDTVTVKVT